MSKGLDLTKLETAELLEQIHDDLYDGLVGELVAGVGELLRRGMTASDALTRGLVAGMEVVGADFRDGILFVPEVLMAAKAMKAGMEILRPLLAETGAPQVGTMVTGTVKGDIHDIGKNLVGMMIEGAGFTVVNLGVNNGVEKFMAAVRKHQPDILGMSALRDRTIVLVGGAPLNDAFAKEIGADAYCRDAAVAVETAKRLVTLKRGEIAPA